MATRAFTANVIGDDVIDATIPVGGTPEQLDDTGVVVLYGDPHGVTVVVAADDEDDAFCLIERAFIRGRQLFSSDAEIAIDDLQPTADEKATLALIESVVGREPLDCPSCGAGPFSDRAAIIRHAEQWHPNNVPTFDEVER